MLTAQVETITPEAARLLLESNTGNRHPKPGVIERIAADITKGRWELNGESLIVAESGRLLDGQNRLMAVVKAGLPIQTLVVRGVPDAVFHTLDTGMQRSIADVLKIKGEKHAAVLANAIIFVWRHLNKGLQYETYLPSPPAAEEVLVACPQLREAVSMSRQSRSQLLPSSLLASLYYIFGDLDHELADKFFGAMAHGDEEVKVFNLLRARLVKNQESIARLPRVIVIALCIKAWNYARDGTEVARLTLSGEENFPELK